jgi:Na+-translocating ferredoxin:NAD+ oxidoreductase RNF subunit RnfB
MIETLDIMALIADLIRSVIVDFVVPHAGIGGGMEVKESVDIASLVKLTLVFLAGLGGLFGIGLALTAQRFAVKIDPRIEKVKDVLAGAHCGACGYPGCEQYAEAVVKNEDVPPNLCTPGGARALEAVARITGKMAEKANPLFSRIMCQGSWKKSLKRFEYEGVKDCRAAIFAGGGDKSCIYGCLGYGTCVSVCPFDAMHMNDEHLPVVDTGKCTGCRKCEKACPKRVIEVLPAGKAVLVECRSRDKGGVVRRHCEVGCIACGKCVKACPYDAPSIDDNLAVIDVARCRVCGLCVSSCPTDAIVDFIPHRPKAVITDKCNGCGKCAKICPVDAASGEKKKMHTIDQARCIGCGICTANCPKQAIDGTFNAKEVFEAAAAKKAAKEEEAAA